MDLIKQWPLLIVIVIHSTACTSDCNTTQWEKYKELLSLSSEEVASRLATYSPEEQVEIYLTAQTCVHPPFVELAWVLAEEKEKMIEPLLDALENADTDHERLSILDVFSIMSCRFLDLRDSVNVVQKSTGAVERLSPENRSDGINRLREIRRQSCPTLRWTS